MTPAAKNGIASIWKANIVMPPAPNSSTSIPSIV